MRWFGGTSAVLCRSTGALVSACALRSLILWQVCPTGRSVLIVADDIVRIEEQRDRTWADLARGPAAQQALSDHAARLYREAFGDAELLELDFGGTVFLFDDFAAEDGREQRTVAAWRIVPKHASARDRSRQAGFPLHASLIAAGFERGHLIARASGGPLDINLYPQAWQVNQGRSEDGKEFRRLETLAARNPGCLQFSRLIWSGDDSVPVAHHILVAIEGQPVAQGVFSNSPSPRPARVPAAAGARMQAGTRFHRTVQSDFLAGLAGAQAFPERSIPLMDNAHGRVDLLIVPSGPERTGVVVEIKNTDFDVLEPHRVGRNARRHLSQLQHYLDRIVDGIGTGEWDSASGVLLYPSRPRLPGRAEEVEAIAERKALTVAWRDECNW